MKKRFVRILGFLLIFFIFSSCGRNEGKYLKQLDSENVMKLESLLHYIENKYNKTINDSTSNRQRIVFVDCKKEDKLSKDYICCDYEVLKRMEELKITEVCFEKIYGNCNSNGKFSEVYFRKKKWFYYPVVYFLYEYCETKEALETPTIYYHPVNKHWSLYIDSNYP